MGFRSIIRSRFKEWFQFLEGYANKEHVIIVSLAPQEAPAAAQLYNALRFKGKPVLDGYFSPKIPAAGTFARCRVNVEHVSEIERLRRAVSADITLSDKNQRANRSLEWGPNAYAFYSYKGGVGRPMALANLGELFHEKGTPANRCRSTGTWMRQGSTYTFTRNEALVSSREHLGLIRPVERVQETVCALCRRLG